MLQDLTSRLYKAAEQKKLRQKLERDLDAVQVELQEKSAQLASMSAQLEKEKVDVEQLKRTSLTALFYSVLGSREEQLEKERQELLSVQLRYQQTKHQVEFLRQEKDGLHARLDQLKGIESEYERLLVEKEGLLLHANQAVARKLIESSEKVAGLKAEVTEIDEAMAAGKEALLGLERVIDSLENAEGWGAWDLLGGGLLSTAMKHSRIDDARKDINEVQAMMSRFKRELADIQKNVDLQIDIDEFTSFADFFFDGLIIDWIVQSRIVDSLERSNQAKDTIAQVVRQLEDLKITSQNKINDLQTKRIDLIEHTQ